MKGFYHDDVRAAQRDIGSVRDVEAFREVTRRGNNGAIHPDLNITGKVRECLNSPQYPSVTPILVVPDLTRSRGGDTEEFFAQTPSWMGSMKLTQVVPDPQVCWLGVGNAAVDRAPIQVSQYEGDRRIDSEQQKLFVENGGGGDGRESFELAAWIAVNRMKLDIWNEGGRGYMFNVTDAAPYPVVSAEQLEKITGVKVRKDIPTEKVFQQVASKYYPFVIYPRSTAEERRNNIDEEIRQRLIRDGGQFKDVDIRCSIRWETGDDLDLHVITPTGYEIFYGNMRDSHGGFLDVDANAGGPKTTKPVENIRWPKGYAPKGKYRFFVHLFARHVTRSAPIKFYAELDVNGEIQRIEGHASQEKGTVELFSFDYSGEARQTALTSAYDEQVVLAEWGKYIPETNILRVGHAGSTIETILGAMALQSGKMTLSQFERSMKERLVPSERRDDVVSALSTFAARGVVKSVSAVIFD